MYNAMAWDNRAVVRGLIWTVNNVDQRKIDEAGRCQATPKRLNASCN